jgi:hypothetical protein
MDLPDHPCPWALRAVRLLQEVVAFKAADGVATTPQVFAGQERIGGKTDLAARLGVKPETADICQW